jgi:hypothetical protein
VVSIEGRATTKLNKQYFVGEEANAIKVEDNLYKDEEKPIRNHATVQERESAILAYNTR